MRYIPKGEGDHPGPGLWPTDKGARRPKGGRGYGD